MAVVAWAGAAWVLAFAWILALGRTAALADREHAAPERPRWELSSEAGAFGAPVEAVSGNAGPAVAERRSEPGDRRGGRRPWGATVAGRRETDGLEAEVAAARRSLREAEEQLAAARAETG